MTLQNLATETDRTIFFKSPIITLENEEYMRDSKGNLVPLELVKPVRKLEDDFVRRLIGYATDLNAQIARFYGHCFEDIGAYLVILAETYDAKMGGPKGNITFTSFDGCMRVQVQISDIIDFGAELHVAKTLLDECLNEWSTDGHPVIRAIIKDAFHTEKEGQINRAAIFMLLRHDVEDDRWIKAMDAIRDAIRVIGSKSYIRFYQRTARDAKWQHITIDLAKV